MPVLAAARDYVAAGIAPGGTHANRRFLADWVDYDPISPKTSSSCSATLRPPAVCSPPFQAAKRKLKRLCAASRHGSDVRLVDRVDRGGRVWPDSRPQNAEFRDDRMSQERGRGADALPIKDLDKIETPSNMSLPILSRKGPLRGHFGYFSRVLGPSQRHVDRPPTASEEVMSYFAHFRGRDSRRRPVPTRLCPRGPRRADHAQRHGSHVPGENIFSSHTLHEFANGRDRGTDKFPRGREKRQ